MRNLLVLLLVLLVSGCAVDMGLEDGSDLMNTWDSVEEDGVQVVSYSFLESFGGKYCPYQWQDSGYYDFQWSIRTGGEYKVVDIDFTYEYLGSGSLETEKESVSFEYYFADDKTTLWLRDEQSGGEFKEFESRSGTIIIGSYAGPRPGRSVLRAATR